MLIVEYITNSIFNSRTYILSDSGSDVVWLVDCGDVVPLLEKIGNRQVQGVLLTHAHFDHIYGLPSFLDYYPRIPIFTNLFGKQALASDKMNMSRYHEQSFSVDCDNVLTLNDGDFIGHFSVYETPGHNPSCICYECGDYLFTGDSYIPGAPVVTNLPGCDKILALKSQHRIIELSKGKVIFPGHELF